jgi:hypothetical protein
VAGSWLLDLVDTHCIVTSARALDRHYHSRFHQFIDVSIPPMRRGLDIKTKVLY